MFFTFIVYCFLAYLLFRLVFNFIIPVFRTARRMKKSFREMNERMQQAGNTYNQQQNASSPQNGEKKDNSQVGDYIDFEEIKD